ncbi:uncharacterized protein LOC107635819 [Arachis ipaensis]|uniref:uncharacterized protein LOC107635819 n=1 Tax=Arachis ipaensis TaxID=130454 RepID=UPI0007AF77EE|nr:uncharacterized protein LOC107635819 [Arachis ipaensis]XP_025644942.1 uncharacterized protein LOC112740460 [Arachis hypogaea]
MQHIKEDYNVQLNRKMITQAIKQARETVLGSEGAQFGKLRDYLNEIHKSNPGSIAHMNTLPQPQGPNLFQRLYISFDACKKGFKNGCRPLIGLDGCFLKGYYGGQLLSAVTQDTNNHVFVIAFGVTRVENTDNWKWFLNCLQEDFGSSMLFGWHLMSDQQKGLVRAVQEVMPNAFHRNCVLYMWKNCEKRFRDKQVKGCVWEAARSTTPVQFKAAMDRLKTVSNGAWEYMSKFDPKVWCRAFFSHYPKNAAVTNNMCESWNAVIVEAREKPILTLCEELRVHIMNKMARHKRILGAYKGKLAPVQQMKLDKWIKPEIHKWNAQWCGDNDRVVFEVSRNTHKLGVNLKNQTCTCNLWQLTGVPCVHAVAAISRVRVKAAEDFVSPFLTMEAIRKTYDICINSVPSEEFWEPTDQLKEDPPKIVRPVGRPVKRRKESATPPAPTDGSKVRRTFQGGTSGQSQNKLMHQRPNPTLEEIRAKLKKHKKKMPKRPHAPQEEMPISQSAPTVIYVIVYYAV